MEQDLELVCRCGHVHGWARDVSPRTVNRAVCYCDDCQAFAHHLGRADLLDAHGGTDIVQLPPARVSFDRGTDRITGLRLGPKGLHRFFAACCKTPVGNTMSTPVPFVGIGIQLFGDIPAERRTGLFGEGWSLMGKFAVGRPPPGSTTIDLKGIAHAGKVILGGMLSGRGWPHPFFDRATRAARYPVTVLSRAERDALRPLCGPNPTSAAPS